MYISEDWSNLFWMIGGVVVGIAASFILTYMFYKEEGEVRA